MSKLPWQASVVVVNRKNVAAIVLALDTLNDVAVERNEIIEKCRNSKKCRRLSSDLVRLAASHVRIKEVGDIRRRIVIRVYAQGVVNPSELLLFSTAKVAEPAVRC
jgi:hypothetical protein